AEKRRNAMNDVDPFGVDPIDQSGNVDQCFFVRWHADRSAGAERNENVAQRSVERVCEQLANTRLFVYLECLNLPADEVIDSFQASRNCFWRACRTRSEVDVAQVIRARSIRRPAIVCVCRESLQESDFAFNAFRQLRFCRANQIEIYVVGAGEIECKLNKRRLNYEPLRSSDF